MGRWRLCVAVRLLRVPQSRGTPTAMPPSFFLHGPNDHPLHIPPVTRTDDHVEGTHFRGFVIFLIHLELRGNDNETRLRGFL